MNEEQQPEERKDDVEDLEVPVDEAERVAGGRKAGKGQQEYLEIRLQDIQISSYNP